MSRVVLLLVLGLLLALRVPAERAVAAAVPVKGWADVAARVIPATVNILVVKVTTSDKSAEDGASPSAGVRQRMAGSGFIVDPSGIIVTNKHVIAGALWITVRLHDGTELPAKLLAASPVVDLAVLKVDAGRPLPTVTLGNSDAARVGEPVLAIGNPEGFASSLTAGIVSGVNRDLMNTPFDDYVQTDAAINPGNSGGPLIDDQGRVIGVNTILVTHVPNEGSNGLGFAISSSVVSAVLRHLLHPAEQPIGWIGVHLQGMTPDLTQALGLPRPGGLIVTGVEADSPARQVGLHAGEVVLRYGEAHPRDARALMREIATTPIGATRTLEVWDTGQMREVTVTIRTWPGVTEPPSAVLADPRRLLPPTAPDLGLLLAPIGKLARQVYKLGDTQGALVVAVDRMSEAYSRGLRPGVVIERVQGQAVLTPVAALRLIQETAARLPVVALLVRWTDGTRWIVLHTGYNGEDQAAGDGAVATGGPPGLAADRGAAASAAPRH